MGAQGSQVGRPEKRLIKEANATGHGLHMVWTKAVLQHLTLSMSTYAKRQCSAESLYLRKQRLQWSEGRVSELWHGKVLTGMMSCGSMFEVRGLSAKYEAPGRCETNNENARVSLLFLWEDYRCKCLKPTEGLEFAVIEKFQNCSLSDSCRLVVKYLTSTAKW